MGRETPEEKRMEGIDMVRNRETMGWIIVNAPVQHSFSQQPEHSWIQHQRGPNLKISLTLCTCFKSRIYSLIQPSCQPGFHTRGL